MKNSRYSTLHVSNKLGIKNRFKNHAISISIGVILLAGIGVGSYFIVKACLTPASATSGK